MSLSRILLALFAAAAISTTAACGDKDTEDSGHDHEDSGHDHDHDE